MEKIVEIADFRQVERAEMLANLLQSEGIDCYIRNKMSSSAFGGLIDMGARVELLESNLPRALEIMKDFGYLQSEEEPDDVQEEAFTDSRKGLERYIPFMRKLSLEKQMAVIIVLLCGLVALIVFLGFCLSDPKY